MASKNIAVYGIYSDRPMVERAVDELKSAGFRNTDISVLFPDNNGNKEFAIEKETKAPEGAAAGAGAGVLAGGALGWLTGIGLLAIPGLGPFIAAGPIMAAMAGAGAGGLIGGIAGALVGMGIPEYEANRYEGRIKEGGILLSVHADDRDWKNKGKEILERTGAEDIGHKGESIADSDETDRRDLKATSTAGLRTQDYGSRDYKRTLKRTDVGDIGHKGESRADSVQTDRSYPKETGGAGLRTNYGSADYKRAGEPVRAKAIVPLA